MTFNEVGDNLPPFGKEFKSYLLLWYCLSRKLVSLAVVFSIVTQRSSKVEANQNTAFDKRSVSKQKHKRAKPIWWTWAFNTATCVTGVTRGYALVLSTKRNSVWAISSITWWVGQPRTFFGCEFRWRIVQLGYLTSFKAARIPGLSAEQIFCFLMYHHEAPFNAVQHHVTPSTTV